jgi:serine kinase of HPr protein (carbohydrate metabolism regulator)
MMPRWLIERAGVQITVRAKSDAARKLVEVALQGMRPERVSKAKGIKLTISGGEDEWRLQDHSNDVKRKIAHSGDLIYHLTDRIVFHIADKVSDKHCLHAASVSYNGNALVIPANSGAGKSSFTTWLVANGFDYLTDELILMDDDFRIDGLARPIQIKSHGIEAIQHLLVEKDPQEGPTFYPGNMANAVPASSLGGQTSEAAEQQLKLMIFPQYKKGAEFEFKKLRSAEAGMSLMANHVNARNLEGHGFKAMMKMIRQTQCYALEYGGFNRLPKDFPQQLRDLLQ